MDSSIIHEVDEAVRLADRILVMGATPGHVGRVVDVPLERPRGRTDDEFVRLVDRLDLDTDESGFVDVARAESPMGGAGRTSVEGVFDAGDAPNGSSPSIVTAAAEGYEVGATVNAEPSDELI